MKNIKFYTLVLLPILLFSNVEAKEVKKAHAEKAAKKYFYEVLSSQGASVQAKIIESFDVKKEGKAVYYAFNFYGGGFIIVSAEDQFVPILGYSDKGEYNEQNTPANWKYLMNEYVNMIVHVRESKSVIEPKYAEQWNYLLSDSEKGISFTRNGVPPLCEDILWNQNYPYNYFCPSDPLGMGGKVYAGCVATAMAIIMHYWRWPLQGEGSHSYLPDKTFCNGIQYPQQSADFENTYYDYNGMPNNATNLLSEPVALLMYHCGVAVDMMYCHSGSGAFSNALDYAMTENFKYSKGLYTIREFLEPDAWEEYLIASLNDKIPVYYFGCNDGCHAFICDGYEGSDGFDYMFHFNFGWSGTSNGWYTSYAPYTYEYEQALLANLKPDYSKGYPYYCSGHKIVPYVSGTIEDGSGPRDNYKANSNASWLIDPQAGGYPEASTITITKNRFDLAEEDYLRFYDGEDETAPLLGAFTAGSDFESIVSTQGKVFVKFTTNESSEKANGFLFSYIANELKMCSLTSTVFNDSSGVFDDGSGADQNYTNGVLCKWRIDVEKASKIYLKFNYFETEADKDLLQIFDISNGTKLVKTLSGTYDEETLPVVEVPSGRVYLLFSTDGTNSHKGFEVRYSDKEEVGVDDITNNINDLLVYPNPAFDRIIISFNTSVLTDDIRLTLYDVQGQKVYQKDIQHSIGSHQQQIDVGRLPKGIYMLQIKSPKDTSTHKIVIQ